MSDEKIYLKDDNYVNIQGWMINRLDLKPSHLLVFAVIFGFSQDRDSRFRGRLGYLMQVTKTSKPTVLKILHDLIEAELIYKVDNVNNGINFPEYACNFSCLERIKNGSKGGKEILPPVKNNQNRGKEILPPPVKNFNPGGKEILPNNTINNTIINNNDDNEKEKVSSLSPAELLPIEIANYKLGTLMKEIVPTEIAKERYFTCPQLSSTHESLSRNLPAQTADQKLELLKGWADVFVVDLVERGKVMKSVEDFASHFKSWLNTQGNKIYNSLPTNQLPNVNIPKTNGSNAAVESALTRLAERKAFIQKQQQSSNRG